MRSPWPQQDAIVTMNKPILLVLSTFKGVYLCKFLQPQFTKHALCSRHNKNWAGGVRTDDTNRNIGRMCLIHFVDETTTLEHIIV